MTSKLLNFLSRWVKLPENIFLVLFISFGLLFTFMIPPGWNTDEPDHTYRITQIVNGNLYSEPVKSPQGNHAFGGSISSNQIDFYKDLGVRDAGANAINTGERVNTLYEDTPNIKEYKNNGLDSEINFSGAALYSPVTYLPYIPAFFAAENFGLSYFNAVLFARIAGLILVLAAFYLSIKYIVVGRWVVFTVGLLPIVVIQAVTIGADAPAIASSILFLTLVTNMIFKKKEPSLYMYGLVVLCGIVLSLAKIAYFPLILLILLIPILRPDWRKLRTWILAVATVLMSIVPALLWSRSVSYIDTNSNLQANFPEQIRFVLSEPITYLKTLFYTFLTDKQQPLSDLFGTSVWASASLTDTLLFFAVALLVVSLFVSSKRDIDIKKYLNLKLLYIWRVGSATVAVITSVVICTVLYVYSTTLRQSTISGIQARYFIPLLTYLMVPFTGNIVKKQFGLKLLLIIGSVILLLGMTFAVYHRLYQDVPLIWS